MNTQEMIRFDNVSKSYPDSQGGLREVSFRMQAGEMAFLTGHSGAGKSTLLKLVGLLERANRGQVWVNGHNLGRLGSREIPLFRRQVGMIFQDHRLLEDRTVFDNVALPLVVTGQRHQEIRRRVQAALDKVGLLNKARALPVTLSGGEQQRVGIARAVVSRGHPAHRHPRPVIGEAPLAAGADAPGGPAGSFPAWAACGNAPLEAS